MPDLAAFAFNELRNLFFDEHGASRDFNLRPKNNTQDDPLDEYIFDALNAAAEGTVKCIRAPGPLISPDLAYIDEGRMAGLGRAEIRGDTTAAVGIEVKKVERGAGGKVGRASGLDYNSTPPCGTIRIYDKEGKSLDIPGFYLFVCLEPGEAEGTCKITALALCDGNLLNSDFKYYIDITGERTKDIGVGTFGDGANRNRPMVIFSNPLGAEELDHECSLVHRNDAVQHEGLAKVGTIERTVADGSETRKFTCYRHGDGDGADQFKLLDPFPMTKKRKEKTSGRGKFTISFAVD